MKKKSLAIILSVATFMMLFPSVQQPAHAGPPFVTYYTVWYNCIISPPCCSEPVGYWVEDCEGNMTGSGWEPGHGCTRTDISYGSVCERP